MRLFSKLLITAILAIFIVLSCNKDDTGYEKFYVLIVNKSTSDIKNIHLSMNGAKGKIRINKLVQGKNSSYRPFILKTFEGNIPKSWGDYDGKYTQRDTLKKIYIYHHEHEFRPDIRILIDDDSYLLISSERFY